MNKEVEPVDQFVQFFRTSFNLKIFLTDSSKPPTLTPHLLQKFFLDAYFLNPNVKMSLNSQIITINMVHANFIINESESERMIISQF